ncbi:MAG TPA: hypothetical protein DCL44_06540 [Elusimicrobia bacterium]|nr:hypothetical protein [Elusimicrobiota bacterium]
MGPSNNTYFHTLAHRQRKGQGYFSLSVTFYIIRHSLGRIRSAFITWEAVDIHYRVLSSLK